MNQAAVRLMNERPAFRVNNNSFSLVRAEDAASLSETLLRLEKGGANGTLGVCVSITCPDNGELFIMRLHPAKASKGNTIFLASIDGESAFSWSLSPEVRRAYRLTAAELRIATLFFEGHDPVEIAGQLKLSEHTVRTHLRNIYAKCGVRGQAELMKKLCRFAM
jgi:DNA-binding CsgD family transcriptional regulator